MQIKQSYILRRKSCGTLNRVPAEKAEDLPSFAGGAGKARIPVSPDFVTSGTYDREVLEWPGLIFVEFYDEWCRYCQEIAPALEKRAAKRQGMLKKDIYNVIRSVDFASYPDRLF